jgi:hypothetical protein
MVELAIVLSCTILVGESALLCLDEYVRMKISLAHGHGARCWNGALIESLSFFFLRLSVGCGQKRHRPSFLQASTSRFL